MVGSADQSGRGGPDISGPYKNTVLAENGAIAASPIYDQVSIKHGQMLARR
jgi:hypothetical protein